MRLTFVLPGFPRHAGGGHKVVYQYANELARGGHRVTIAHLRAPNPDDASGLNARLLGLRLAYRINKRRRPSWFELDRRVSVVNGFRQNSSLIPSADVVIATSVRTADFVSELGKDRHTPTVYFIQHFEDFTEPPAEVERTWALPMHRIVVSNWLADTARTLGLAVDVVQNGVSVDEFTPGPPISARALAVVGLASDLPWKRTDVLIEALERIRKDLPVDASVFGTCPRPEGLPAWVSYHRSPSRQELRELLSRARVYLCTSDTEGFGLPPAEAMACRTAVVSTRNGGVESFAEDVALFTDRGDAAGLADATTDLLLDEDSCQTLASAGESRVRGMTVTASARNFELSLKRAVRAHNALEQGRSIE